MKKRLGIAILLIVLSGAFFFIQSSFMTKDSSTRWHLPLSGKTIIIDPGHGGVDGGATSAEGVLEKDVALSISLMLREYLQAAGAIVFLTREGDYDLASEDVRSYRKRKTEDLHKRVELINESDADLFISLHLNAIESTRWSGAQTFFHPRVPDNETIAFFIQEQLKINLENTNRVTKPIKNVFILESAHIPGVLVEAGFLSNREEAALLATETYQNKVAASIYEGILRYYSGEKSPLK